jgi:2-(1,2-epoxy-1,2-dihydrophenyl)acetyl-CoA isomerase
LCLWKRLPYGHLATDWYPSTERGKTGEKMNYETIRFEKRAHVATITMNRPKALNALNVTLCRELLEALKACEWDEDIRAVILTGTGRAFCAGGDIRLIKDFLEDYPSENPGKIIKEIVSAFHPLVLAIRKLNKPVVGAVNGFCSGGGAGLAQACDILIAAENAAIHMSYVYIGEDVDGGKRATELLFTGGSLNAQEAHALGLFNRVVPAEDLQKEAEAFARRLASGPLFALGRAKEVLNQAAASDLETQLENEKGAVIDCAGSPEFKEGITAFFEKRKPEFIKA